jgi:hypothetical protein
MNFGFLIGTIRDLRGLSISKLGKLGLNQAINRVRSKVVFVLA